MYVNLTNLREGNNLFEGSRYQSPFYHRSRWPWGHLSRKVRKSQSWLERPLHKILFSDPCVTEENISYFGYDINNGLPEKSSPESCSLHCKSAYPGEAKYFDWISPSLFWGPRKCFCKTSNAGRIASNGVVAGKICHSKQEEEGESCSLLATVQGGLCGQIVRVGLTQKFFIPLHLKKGSS